MFDLDRWTEIWVTITRNKTRSILTCFGVFWGILMLVLLLGSGTGFKNTVFRGTEGFASNSAFFEPDRTSLPYHGFNKGRHWEMHNKDVTTIQREVKGLEAVAPINFTGRGDKNVVYGNNAGSYNIIGITPQYFTIMTQKLIYGRLLNEIDLKERRKVCLIGVKICETLFRNEDPCGKYIRVNGLYCQVVGVVNPISSSFNIGGRGDEMVFLSFPTLQQAFNQGDVVHLLSISVYKDYPMQQAIDNVKAILKRQNEISPDDDKAVWIMNVAEQFATFNKLFLGIDFLVWLVGMGTLIAGVIGISNIMMVTVKERTREIGVRRAIGAKPWNIVSQIMSESITLTAIAGMLGLSLGVLILDIIDRIISANAGEDTPFLHPGVNIGTALTATIVLLVCGMLAGLIPAWRAMKIKAIDAIRDE